MTITGDVPDVVDFTRPSREQLGSCGLLSQRGATNMRPNDTADEDSLPERVQTDCSLGAERRKTDEELGRASHNVEHTADLVVDRARQRADDTLTAAAAKADAALNRQGASSEALATAKTDRVTERATLSAERISADVLLERERDERHRAIRDLLQLERGTTDKHLMLERARADEGLRLIMDQLSDAVRAREEFVLLAGHELKTPLTPMRLRLDSLAREAAGEPESAFSQRVRIYTEVAKRQMGRLTTLVADLLDVSRIASGRFTLDLAPIDLGAVVRDVADRHRAQAAKAQCELHVDTVPIVGHWDALRLDQTITNLLENALKFGAGKPIHVCLEPAPVGARLTVRDEGIGIGPEHLAEIFQRFSRAGHGHSHYGGLGVGLYICRLSVEALGGTIAVHSELGRGSTFTVDLPLSGPDSLERSSEAPLGGI